MLSWTNKDFGKRNSTGSTGYTTEESIPLKHKSFHGRKFSYYDDSSSSIQKFHYYDESSSEDTLPLVQEVHHHHGKFSSTSSSEDILPIVQEVHHYHEKTSSSSTEEEIPPIIQEVHHYHEKTSSSSTEEEIPPIIQEVHHYVPVESSHSTSEEVVVPPVEFDKDEINSRLYEALEILQEENKKLCRKLRRVQKIETSIAINEIHSVKSEAVSEIEALKKEVFDFTDKENRETDEIAELRSEVSRLNKLVENLIKVVFRTQQS